MATPKVTLSVGIWRKGRVPKPEFVKIWDDDRLKFVMGAHEKHELIRPLIDTAGLVPTCKAYTDTFVNLNGKAVTSHYFFTSVCLRLWRRRSCGPRHMKGMCSHIGAPHEVFFPVQAIIKTTSVQTHDMFKNNLKVDLEFTRLWTRKKQLKKVNSRTAPAPPEPPPHTWPCLIRWSAQHFVFHYWIT